MREKLEYLFAYIGFISFLFLLGFFISHAVAAETTEAPVCLDKEQVMELKQIIQKQVNETAEAEQDKVRWYQEYRKLKMCVRASKDHLQALSCLGDHITLNENKQTPSPS